MKRECDYCTNLKCYFFGCAHANPLTPEELEEEEQTTEMKIAKVENKNKAAK